MLTQERLLEIVRQLPEVRLEIVVLTWQLTGEDGQLDENKIAYHYSEIEKAAAQAEAYARDTREMVRCLNQLLR